MNRKWIGVVIAVALAVVGTWVLVRYVQGAENRALEGEKTVAVLVVDAPVAAGSAASEIGGKVRIELVPVKVQAPGSVGSVEDLEALGDRVASVDLVPGEQIIEARFVTVEAFDEQDEIEVPEGLMELTLSLTPERSVGGTLRPGDQVAVFASFEPFTIDAIEPGDTTATNDDADQVAGTDESTAAVQSAKTPNTTHIILHKVLVTNVQVEELPQETASEESGTSALEVSPTGNLLVTLAMAPENAERFVFTSEYGSVWLADEPDSVDETMTIIQDRATVYHDPLFGEE